jgi:hypothetical protein
MLPSSVESKVEQYLKYSWAMACVRSQRWAAKETATASSGGRLRLLRATTTASTPAAVQSRRGGPNSRTVPSPSRRRALATSVPPV